jgi:hypothetical protein
MKSTFECERMILRFEVAREKDYVMYVYIVDKVLKGKGSGYDL